MANKTIKLDNKEVRILRKRLRLSLLELAEASDLSESYLSLFENGKRDLSPDAKGQLLKALIRKIDDRIELDKREAREREKERLELESIGAELQAAVIR